MAYEVEVVHVANVVDRVLSKEVKMIGDSNVPSAYSVPCTSRCEEPYLNFTTVPGSIVRVAPLATVTLSKI